jgi:hypothetical protein
VVRHVTREPNQMTYHIEDPDLLAHFHDIDGAGFAACSTSCSR